jgi:hypothetical protein
MKERTLDEVHPDLHYAWEEKAAILETMWDMSREEAEALTWGWYDTEKENLSRSIGV